MLTIFPRSQNTESNSPLQEVVGRASPPIFPKVKSSSRPLAYPLGHSVSQTMHGGGFDCSTGL